MSLLAIYAGVVSALSFAFLVWAMVKIDDQQGRIRTLENEVEFAREMATGRVEE